MLDPFRRHLCAILLTSALLILAVRHRADGRGPPARVIHVLGLFELTTRWGRRAEAESEIAAAELAIRHVNQRGVLPNGVRLSLLVNDTKCDPGVGIDAFFHAIYSNRQIGALLGTTCSNVTESLAHVVPYWNILQISAGSTSPLLSDRAKFPLFFRTIAPESSHNAAKLAFVAHFGWRVIATFCQSENEYLLPLNGLISAFEAANVSCVATVTFAVEDFVERLKVLRASDVRVIIASFDSQLIARIFCAVHALGMFGAEYVWVLQERGGGWGERGGCPPSHLRQATDGLILVDDYNVVAGNGTALSGLDNDLFEAELGGGVLSKYARLTYDAIWVMALAFRNFERFEFDYTQNRLVCKMVNEIAHLNFMGVSVNVYLLSAGFSLVFGSMFAKTYRIHRIFASTTSTRPKLLKDHQLIVLILVPLVIDAIILSLWLIIDPIHHQFHNLTLEINAEDRGVVYQPQVAVCRSRNTIGWLLALYSYKGLILTMGVFMAWETRHVKIQALNDSQYIGICVYSAVFSAIVTVLSSLINQYVIIAFLAQSITILASTSLSLLLLFVPKLKSAFGNQNGHQDALMQSMGLKIECKTRRFIQNDPNEQIARLEIQNRVYRSELAALDAEIKRLECLELQLNSRKISESRVYAICRNSASLDGWASWPGHVFQAKNRSERVSVIETVKRVVLGNFGVGGGGCRSVDLGRESHRSNPEFQNGESLNSAIVKTKSENFTICHL